MSYWLYYSSISCISWSLLHVIDGLILVCTWLIHCLDRFSSLLANQWPFQRFAKVSLDWRDFLKYQLSVILGNCRLIHLILCKCLLNCTFMLIVFPGSFFTIHIISSDVIKLLGLPRNWLEVWKFHIGFYSLLKKHSSCTENIFSSVVPCFTTSSTRRILSPIKR